MKPLRRYFFTSITLLIFVVGCATHHAHQVGFTPMLHAHQEIPENQLLDVGVGVFESDELTEKKAKKEGVNAEIRKAETHFMPDHLKRTLQQSGQWGAVRVAPAQIRSMDLLVHGKILESNGERLVLKIEAKDAVGRQWLSKTYAEAATDSHYSGNLTGQKDAFQSLYNAIANDLVEFKSRLNPADIQNIRTIAKLRFAQDFAPDAFGAYLKEDKRGRVELVRLPADDDPMMARLLQIREREYMYVDALNHHYEIFSNSMWSPYENWRRLNLTEQKAIKKVKKEALTRQIVGALLVAGAIALGAGEVENTGSLQVGMVIIGGQVIIDGFNVSRQAQIHSAAIEELSESFGNEMQPMVMDFQGKKYELTGSAEEQFKRWRELLRKIYAAETGFDKDHEGVKEIQ